MDLVRQHAGKRVSEEVVALAERLSAEFYPEKGEARAASVAVVIAAEALHYVAYCEGSARGDDSPTATLWRALSDAVESLSRTVNLPRHEYEDLAGRRGVSGDGLEGAHADKETTSRENPPPAGWRDALLERMNQWPGDRSVIAFRPRGNAEIGTTEE